MADDDLNARQPGPTPLEQLPSTARELLDAARRIVLRRGFHSLTLQAIQDETGHNKAMVNHYFGSKAGLVTALFDSLARDQEAELRRRIDHLQDRDQPLQALVEDQRQVSGDRRGMRAYAELLPHMLRENRLLWRLAGLYQAYRQLYAWSLGASGGAEMAAGELDDVASLALAVTDGLGIQATIDPDNLELEGPYRVWQEMLDLYLKAHAGRVETVEPGWSPPQSTDRREDASAGQE